MIPSAPVARVAGEAARVDAPQAITVEAHYRGGDATEASSPNYGGRTERHEASVGAMPSVIAASPASSPPTAIGFPFVAGLAGDLSIQDCRRRFSRCDFDCGGTVVGKLAFSCLDRGGGSEYRAFSGTLGLERFRK